MQNISSKSSGTVSMLVLIVLLVIFIKTLDISRSFIVSKCNNCFSVTVKSIFQDTKILLQKWLLVIILFLKAKKGIPAKQIQRNLNISYPTSWRMLHQIRKAMDSKTDQHLFTGILKWMKLTSARNLVKIKI
ncbi:hypothetical protein SAMN02745150_01385 [Brevinema andersonii]|uniref:Uncharacterized protein n=1 Tax=Brevinema andersonii TaxID=34097 RepID=A0A1I1F4S0_BREAD|nr:hypothetical protein SAMN02745150_01385 [Brevinema andersonii]